MWLAARFSAEYFEFWVKATVQQQQQQLLPKI
jgi:hypothetical protein